MANYPLAALLSMLGNVTNAVGKHYGDKAALKEKFRMYSEQDAANRPAEEAQRRRNMIMGMGLDPDTLEPVPGYFEALERRKQMEQNYRGKSGGKGGGDDGGRRKRRNREETPSAGESSGGGWFSKLFN